jgi:hypothetical protein
LSIGKDPRRASASCFSSPASLPPTLAGLAAVLDELGEKGEQEGYL